jgi:8-oxo-dGTP pyrophosphatase MutT (NUDIX family)
LPRPLFDPLTVPVDFVGDEAPLSAERLNSDWIRDRLVNQLPWTVEDDDERHWRQMQIGRPVRQAAVLIPIVQRAGGLTMLLTQRDPDLTDHPGQISFPGGRVEESDGSPIETALRETEEEIGLSRTHIEIVGELPLYRTGTGYCVTPVIGLVKPPFDLQPDVREVAEVFEVPLAFLMSGANHQRHTVRLPGQTARRTFYSMPYQHYFIWGATAAMIRNLFHLLRN